jgi:elongator complex protein 2
MLTHAISVTGPADWVRSLAFSAAPQLVEHFGAANVAGWAGSRQEAVLAVASQDAKLRLFRIRCKSYEHATAEAAATPVVERAVTSAASALAPAGAEDDDDDVLAAATAPSAGGAPGVSSSSAGWADPEALLLSDEDPVLAALQRPRAFTVTIPSRGGAHAAALKATFEVTLDALLSGGHDALVSTVRWLPPLAVAAAGVAAPGAGEASFSPSAAWRLMQAPCVLSASMDKSVIMWQPEGADAGVGAGMGGGASSVAAQEAAEARMWEGVWQPVLKVGAAGGAVAGFHGAFLTRDLSLLFAHGFQGSLHSWAVTPSAAAAGTQVLGRRCTDGLPCLPSAPAFSLHALKEESIVQPRPCAQGHAGPVTDLQWAPSGDYLLSASLDFTTRVWAPVALQGGAACRPELVVAEPEPSSGAGGGTGREGSAACHQPLLPVWLEVSRPQIHGYEMNAAVLPAHPRLRHRLISAGDEKVLRVFDAPRLFTRTLRLLRQPAAALESGADPSDSSGSSAADGDGEGNDDAGRAEFAYVPELALTNKAVLPGGVGGPIKDRFQADGRDAGPMGPGAGGGDDGEGGSGMAAAGAAASSAPAASAAPAAATAASAASTLPISSAAASTVAGLLSTAGGVAPPLDEDLVQGTRWPEANKLFGHGHEVVALAVNSAGTLVASACKARDDVHASIMLWDAGTGRLLQQLPAHKLTVVAMAFSPAPACISAVASLSSPAQQVFARAGELPAEAAAALSSPICQSEYLVSASKDRCVALWAALPQAGSAAPSASAAAATAGSAGARPLHPRYALVGLVRDAHKRIIWGADWAPLPLDREGDAGLRLEPQQQLFCTGARDPVVTLWSVSRGPDAAESAAAAPGDGSAAAAGAQLALAAALPAADHAVTAVAFAPLAVRRRGAAGVSTLRLTLAAGHEDGSIVLWAAVGASEGPAALMRWHCEPLVSVSGASKHVGSVSRLAWRPPLLSVASVTTGSHSQLQLQLASASADESLRIFRVLLALLAQ